MKNIFPQKIWPDENYSNPLSTDLWLQLKPKDMMWYATGYEILSPTNIRLNVYGIQDPFHGGIGPKIHEQIISTSEMTPQQRSLLEEELERLYTKEAAAEFDRREAEAREQKIKAIRKELFGK